ncbi:zinc finger protein Xfin isoform X1 [Drosophila guanche]|uniref:Blast:TBC1 domain family member 10A n=1 Tax=Drosophila guanche TaxID=7266 RepID=A0A3B0K2E4_DROGU|nr:zinc finger protein Xfin isoform X1 [Drosophila guanche]XP_034138467.1 zinc finger protein Xfin isoform X1 [Drosophila guanche]SPP88465.1 blast:TBC1 domain family member 10A [Drosophila guanche]
MEGMDLWTSMFSADLEEDEEEIDQYANENGLDSNLAGDSDDILPEEDDDEEEEEGEVRPGSGNGKTKEPDLDDDTIFDFDLEPIVSIGESQPSPQLALTDPPETSVRLSGVVTRPTTSQINATDANGVPINYELGVIYICPACGEEFRQQDLWKRHMNQMHQFNTRRGLNFMAMDKLYHRCLECNKRIAMHSRENLLKHKFTHLPFRCTKCYICKREYKYRQDLMVHLRMVHCDEVVAMMREGFNLAGRKTRVREPRTEQMQRKDPFPEEDDERNDILEPEMMEGEAPQRRRKKRNQGGLSGDGSADLCEDYIHYMCPDCGTECDTHAQWSQHIEFVHDYVSRRGLNFISVDMQMQCLECKKIVIPNTIKTLRAHKFTHLPQPEWLRCKLCYKGYREHHELVTHLLKQHQLESLMPEESPDTSPVKRTDRGGDDWEDHGNASAFDDVSSHFEDVPRRGGRIGSDDIYEPHIDYLCPQCGKEFIEKKHWRTHVVQVHGMNDVTKLNFAIINDRQLKCTECAKIITNAYGIQNAQQHRITHLPFKAYARCRKCHKSYTDRKGLVKHLATYHRVGYVPRKNFKMGGRGVRLFESPKQQRKQIVTLGKETYEIIFLDEEQVHSSVDEENDFGEQMQMPDEDDLPTVSAGLLPPNPNRYKCVECGTLFPTQVALKLHISEAHALRDPPPYAAPKKMEKNLGKEDALKKRRLGSAEALVSAAAAATSGPSAGTVEENYIFLCPSCGEEYKTQFEWRRHINEAHNFDKRQYLNMRQLDKYRYQCTQCNDIVCNSKLKGLQDHHFRHLPFRLYLKCLVCGTCYNHKPNIAAHLRTRHNIYERETPWRELQTKPQYSYVQAKEKDRDTVAKSRQPKSPAPSPAVVASSSGSSVGSRLLWTQSEKRPTRPAGLNTLEDSISYHNAVDMDFITYYCPKCNKNFDSHAFWRKHIVEHHNFNSREGLNFRQIDIHHYLCLECYKRVTVTHTKGAIGQLQSHKFRHLPYRSFKCLTCNGEFVRKQMFFKHLNRDTNRCDNKPNAEKEFDDEEHETCGDASTEDADAEASAYRLMCPQCGDDFTTSNQGILRNHLNVSHGLGKQLLHIRKVGEGLYRCNDCDEELATKSKCVLQQHRFKHMPHAAYIICQLCKSGSEEKAAELHSMRELHQHIHEHHPAVEVCDERVQRLRQLIDEEEEADEDSQPPENSGNGSGSTANNGPYMPLPPHLLDEVDDLDFEDQFLLGGC